ncbi:non-ribosomal peptide synthetase [Thalassovita sp.]|uniref:non-ribosomal peptide synthetase n=1 Tax=Thalassovita sp. TaxID=1979401 RepID=UPI002AAF422F|nr:AMP-binding protein [Thalassovita sp.]
MKNFGQQVIAALRQKGAEAALICTEQGDQSGEQSGDQFADQLLRLSRQMIAAGAAEGSRVALIAPQPEEAVRGFLAALHSHTAAPLNPDYTTDEFLFYLQDLRPSLVLLGQGASAAAEAAVAQMGLNTLRFADLAGAELAAEHAPAAPDDVAMILHTSGTTARPKMVALTQANLAASCANIAASLSLDATDRSLCAMPLFHIHGLMASLCAPLLARGSVVLTGKFNPVSFTDALSRFQPTWYSAVPTIHLALINHLEGIGQFPDHSLRLIRSSSASLPPSVIARLETAFGAPLIEAYGMTEASHQIAANPLPPAQRKPGTVGPASGTEIDVVDDAGTPLAAGVTGHVVIRGAGVTPGYIDHPEANAEGFRGGSFWTGDLGFLDPEGYLTLTGRSKEQINRGGQKISPREVDEALMDIEGIADAVAFAMPHDSLGEDLVAAVILQPGQALSAQDIRLRLFERLADYKVPSQIAVVDHIPVGATGKRQRLQMWSALKGAFAVAPQPPRDALEFILCEFTAEALGLEEIGRDDNFFNLGGNSIIGLQLSITLGGLLGCHVVPSALFRFPTVEALADHLRPQMSQDNLDRLEAAVQDSAEDA